MTTLSYAQIRAYAQAAGAADPDTAAAIALAESGGSTTAHNIIPPDDSYGLWQINMLGSLGPARRKSLGISSNSSLFDPATNARAMALISKGGTDFSAWSTYKSGSYRKYVQSGSGATDAGYATPAGDITDIPGEAAGAAKDTADIAISAANWVVNPSNWLRVLYVVAGAAVVLVGIDMLVQNEILGRAAKALGGDGGGSTAKSAAVVGKKIFSPGGKAKSIGKAAV